VLSRGLVVDLPEVDAAVCRERPHRVDNESHVPLAQGGTQIGDPELDVSDLPRHLSHPPRTSGRIDEGAHTP
jgi:hypothetical protein